MFSAFILLLIVSAAVGSFLNVLIYRLPLMIEQRWRKECEQFLNKTTDTVSPTFNLAWPNSHCPQCQHTLKWWHNIPLLSFLLLRGRCAFCHKTIPLRYFLVELLSVIASLVLLAQYHFSWPLLFFLLFTWLLIAIAFIDAKHFMIPDELNYSLLWLGLLFSITPWSIYVSPTDAIMGAVTGYLLFAIVAYIFKQIRKKEGLGQGDFKLLAALGAWLGWQLLPWVILISGLLGLLFGLITRRFRQPFPFGPFLVIAGWVVLAFYRPILSIYLH